MLRRAANARENDAIRGIRVRRALVQRRHARRVVLYHHDGRRDVALAKRRGQLRLGRRAANEGDAFAFQIRDALDAQTSVTSRLAPSMKVRRLKSTSS